MRTVRITAKTIEAAVQQGLEQLGISREEAIVHVVEQPSSGLFGMFHKKMAVVDISAPEEAPEEVTEDAPAEETLKKQHRLRSKKKQPLKKWKLLLRKKHRQKRNQPAKNLCSIQKNRNRPLKKRKPSWLAYSAGCISRSPWNA